MIKGRLGFIFDQRGINPQCSNPSLVSDLYMMMTGIPSDG
ncbi:hypothetical protein MTBBW1_2540007 [Desulfamplus magnetovallimortis]|uniref:Uncharacterized protein n=1 Tax=Desulfamplus magnetovallimortis TaxID=1246637 RepID=A0A1W1HEM3_9BACT|nr:hypothetical protein MTBBW1_2540007 [Desulfamplus magnetovallimortis]